MTKSDAQRDLREVLRRVSLGETITVTEDDGVTPWAVIRPVDDQDPEGSDRSIPPAGRVIGSSLSPAGK